MLRRIPGRSQKNSNLSQTRLSRPDEGTAAETQHQSVLLPFAQANGAKPAAAQDEDSLLAPPPGRREIRPKSTGAANNVKDSRGRMKATARDPKPLGLPEAHARG